MDDVKEKVDSQFDKVFQRQVLKLKTLKGVGSEDKQPSRKEQGYLSIEKVGAVHCLVFRSFLGANLFSGVINPKISKVKELTPEEHSNGKKKASLCKGKASVAVKDPQTGKFEVEHCEITFANEADRALFTRTFSQLVK